MSQSSLKPILVVDKKGTLGSALVTKLSSLTLTVFVSSLDHPGKNVIAIPFHKKIPRIPNNSFSTIIIFYSGESELEQALPSFIKKAQETGARLLLVTSIFHYKEKIAEAFFKQYDHAEVVVLGDVFAGVELVPTPVNHLLWQAKTHGRVELLQNGLGLLYPVSLIDAVTGIEAATFSLAEDKQIFAVMPIHPYTELSFVRLLQKKYPLLQVDFLKGNFRSHYSLPHSAIPALEEYNLEEELYKLDLNPPVKKSTIPLKKIKGNSRMGKRRRSYRSAFFILSLIFFLLALPFIVTLTTAMGGGMLLKQAKLQAEKGQLPNALRSSQSAVTFLRLSDDTATTVKAVVGVVGLSNEVAPLQRLVHAGKEVAEASTEFLQAGVQLQTILTSSNKASKEDFLSAIGTLKEAALSLQTIEAEDQLPESYKKSLTKLNKPLGLLINLLDASPKLLGFDSKQQYLLLFQNNFELRPGGGFIGSYGLLQVDHGKIVDLKINDVYDADGKLKANIEPPFGLNRYMGAPHWFLRDSNFDPDFVKSASQAASFLKLETGENVNGVIGLDVSFLSSLLDATGPITLPDYNKTLTKDNFYLLTQSQVEDNFFPGSTQKKDFLRAAETELMRRIETRKFSYQKMITLMTSAVGEKHLLFAFSDPTIQKLFAINNLSGTLQEKRIADATTYLDSIGINEANIGQNKSNYYLKRSIDQDITIDGEGVVKGVTSIIYTNTSSPKTPFGGEYKAYLRLITPQETTLTKVQVDGKDEEIVEAVTDPRSYLSTSFRPPAGVEVDTRDSDGKTQFGLLIAVPAGQTKKISLSYTLLHKVNVDLPKWTYALHTIKQQGTLSDPYRLTIHYPLAVRLFTANQKVNDLGGKAILETTLTEDRDTNFTFTSK